MEDYKEDKPTYKERKESKKNDEALLKWVIEKRDIAIKFRKDIGWNEMVKRAWNYYMHGQAEDFNDAELGNREERKANYVFSNIESIIPKIFDKMPGFQVVGRGEEDAGKAPKVETILRYKLEKIDLEGLLEDMTRDQLVPSMGVMKIGWSLEEAGAGIVEDDLSLEVIDPLLFWITAGDKRLQSATGCFEKMFLDPKEVKKRWKKDLKADAYIGKDDDKKREGKVCVWQFSGIYNDKKQFIYFTDKEVLGVVDFYEHGRIPYAILPNYRKSQEFYPISEVYNIEPLQEELVEIDIQMSEFRKRGVNPKKFVKKGAVDKVNMERLKDPRVNVVEMSDTNHIQWEKPGNIGSDIYNMRQMKKEDIGLMTGQNELSRGGTEQTVKTATGQQIMFDAAQGRIRQKVRALKNVMREILMQTQGLLAQFQDREEMIKITDASGDVYEGYTKEDVQGSFDFEIDIVESMPLLRERRSQLALEAYKMFKDDPVVDQLALKKKVLKLAFQDIGASELIKDETEEEIIEEEMQPIPQEQLPELQGLPNVSAGGNPMELLGQQQI